MCIQSHCTNIHQLSSVKECDEREESVIGFECSLVTLHQLICPLSNIQEIEMFQRNENAQFVHQSTGSTENIATHKLMVMVSVHSPGGSLPYLQPTR